MAAVGRFFHQAKKGISIIERVKVLTVLVADWYITQSPFASPATVNFLIFVPIFSIISIVYLEAIPRLAPRGKLSHSTSFIRSP